MNHRIRTVSIFPLLSLALIGCAAHPEYKTQANFWPVATYETEIDGTGSRFDALGPLIAHRSDEDSSSLTIFPLYNSSDNGAATSTTVGIPELLPLF